MENNIKALADRLEAATERAAANHQGASIEIDENVAPKFERIQERVAQLEERGDAKGMATYLKLAEAWVRVAEAEAEWVTEGGWDTEARLDLE